MQISIVMPAYNAEKYISGAINSALIQSFRDFELIIVDDGSTDHTISKIKSFKDKRIVLIENEHNYINSLNKGMQAARAKYIARMDADDIMHIDRLKIQHSIMEAEPSITVCSSWMQLFGEKVNPDTILRLGNGSLEDPLIHLIKGTFISHPTVMMRKEFLQTHNLLYSDYPHAEDYKLWFEIAKLGGVFFTESQILHYYRVSNSQVTSVNKSEQLETNGIIKQEIIDFCINHSPNAQLQALQTNFKALQEQNLLSYDEIYEFFYALFSKNKNTLQV